jgi:hypothetical protein
MNTKTISAFSSLTPPETASSTYTEKKESNFTETLKKVS